MNNNNFMVPVAIVIAGALIAGAVYFGGSTVQPADTPEVQGTTDTVAEDTNQPAAEQNPTNLTVKIGDDPVLGDRDSAKVAIVEFSDFECPYCKRFHDQTFDQLVSTYVDTGDAIIVYKDFPLSFHDPNATEQALASECVQKVSGDDAYWKYNNIVYETTTSNKSLSESAALALVDEIGGVDRGQFDECYNNDEFKAEIAADIQEGRSVGITGTPGFIVGTLNDDGSVTGERVVGAQPFASFEQVITKYL